MTALSLRRGVSLVLVLAVVVGGGFVAPAAASDGSDNSSFTTELAVESDRAAGDGRIDCTGEITGAHTCDKDGEFDAGAVSIEYEGFNRGGPATRSYGFGDDISVTVLDRERTVAFTCEFDASPSGNPCPVSGAGPGDV